MTISMAGTTESATEIQRSQVMNQSDLTAVARAEAQAVLTQMPSFPTLSRAERFDVYRRLVDERLEALQRERRANGGDTGRAAAMRVPVPAGRRKASDMIDDQRHENRRIEQAGELAGDFVDNVDFPGFVRDLLKGVFDANLNVTLQQMAAYQEMLKAATASVAKFVNAIDDTAAFGYLAENNSDDFGLTLDDDRKGEDGQPALALTDKDGNKLDIGDNEVKARIMEAKIAMAREQRALLRETILMGITRLVVEKGVVKASVLFDIKASEKIVKADKAALKESVSKSGSIKASGGLVGAIFGGPSGGGTHSSRKTQISIASTKSEASTDLSAKLAGSVEIQFKSDYFKLDNFAAMYSGDPAAGGAGAAPATPGGALPPPPR
jgi:hypothetical protein